MTKQTSVLITGSSKGFGLFFAEKLAQEGHRVYAGARNLQASDELQELAKKHSNLKIFKLDVLNQADIQQSLSSIEELENGTLGVLINNAGYGLRGPVADLTAEALEHQFATNLFAVVELSRKSLPLLKKAEPGGLIVNLSSIASYLGLPSFGAYSASKAALNALSMSLAVENAKDKLSVAVVEPGPFKTQFRSSVKYVGSEQDYTKLRSSFFGTQQDPSPVIELINRLVQQKLSDQLGPYTEIPIGKNANLFRVLSRWLPQELFVNLMISKLGEDQ